MSKDPAYAQEALLAKSCDATVRSLPQQLQRWANERTNNLAVSFLDHTGTCMVSSYTFGELEKRVASLSNELRLLVNPGDRVILLYPPGMDFILGFLATLCVGAIAVPAPPPSVHQKRNQRLKAILDSSQPALALTTGELREKLNAKNFDQFANVELHTLTGTETTTLPVIESLPDSVAILQYTSGSTADAKGVSICHSNLWHNNLAIMKAFNHDESSCALNWLPPYHDMGLIGAFLQPISVGFHAILMSPVHAMQRPLRWLQAISKWRGTSNGGPNFVYQMLNELDVEDSDMRDLDLSCWKVAFTGAEPIQAETISRFNRKFARAGFQPSSWHCCYGLAEATLYLSGRQGVKELTVGLSSLEQGRVEVAEPGSSNCKSLVSCGTPVFAEDEVRIVDPQICETLPQACVGEIWFRSKSVSKGYWGKRTLSRQVFNEVLNNGSCSWLRTGDLGFIYNNEVFITGRLKELIIVRGRNIFPSDIEWTVQKSHSALQRGACVAFGIERQGPEGDQHEELIVVQEVRRSCEKTVNHCGLRNTIRTALHHANGVVPSQVLLVRQGAIPKTTSGKVRRNSVRAMFRQHELLELESPPGSGRLEARL